MHPSSLRRRRAVRAGLGAALLVATIGLFAARTAEERETTSQQPAPSTEPAGATDGTDATGAPTTLAHRRHSGPLLVVGDSLTLGADSAGLSRLLATDGWQPTVIAEVGRSTKGAIAALQSGPRTVSRLVLVELGTNPSSAIGTFPAEVDDMVRLLRSRGAEVIVWVNPVHHDDDRYGDKDLVLEAKAAADPAFFVADWASIASAHKSWFRSDGLHYDSTGFTALAHLMADEADKHDPA